MHLENYFSTLGAFNLNVNTLPQTFTVIKHGNKLVDIIHGLINEFCLAKYSYKSYKGIFTAQKKYYLNTIVEDGYTIYEYQPGFSIVTNCSTYTTESSCNSACWTASGETYQYKCLWESGTCKNEGTAPCPTPGPAPGPSPESKCVTCKLGENNARISNGPCCSALDLATSWVNTVDCDSCPYALAISFGEGNDLQTASSTDPLAGINSGLVPDCENHPEEECPGAFPMSYLKSSGGPFQVQSLICNDDDLDCYNKQALQYIKDNCKTLRSTMKYIFGNEIASKGDEYTWCGCTENQPESSTPGFNGSCSSLHKNKDYYTNMLPTAQKVCKKVSQCSQHIF